MSSSQDSPHLETERKSGEENEIAGSTRQEYDNVPISQEQPQSQQGLLSTKSSETQVGLMSSTDTKGIKQEVSTEDNSRVSKESHCEQQCPTTDKSENQEPCTRSTLQSILLVATCTVAMILNVSYSTTFYYPASSTPFI